MYAELTGNRKKYRIKSRYDNKFVVEGRWLFDAFVLNNKKSALYYDGEISVEEPDPMTFTNAKNMAELNKMLQNSAPDTASTTSTQKAAVKK